MKKKRKDKEYFFETHLQCGEHVQDYFSEVMELYDYFIPVDKGCSFWIRGYSLTQHCRFSIGIYTPEMQPLAVQVCMPDAEVHLKKAAVRGAYVLRRHYETTITGDYQIRVFCETGILTRTVLRLSEKLRRRMPF